MTTHGNGGDTVGAYLCRPVKIMLKSIFIEFELGNGVPECVYSE